MVWTHRGRAIPLEVYHGVPKGWYAQQIVAEHAQLGGTFDLNCPEATEPGAPSWMPERHAWLQYRQALYRLADGILAQDAACVELAIRYIELRYIGSYSGFVRSLLSRRLKHASLSKEQKTRLHRHFAGLVKDDERTEEFRDYVKLWRQIVTDEELETLAGALRAGPTGEAKAQHLFELLRPNPTLNRTGRQAASGSSTLARPAG
jgi:hypothetical protein